MKYAIFSKSDGLSLEIEKKINIVLQNHELNYESPDFIISIGGDGTFLKAVEIFHKHLDHALFISVNTGKLGFYTNFSIEDIDNFDTILSFGQGIICEHTMLEYALNGNKHLALNEVTISNPPHLQNYLIYVDDFLFEDYYGNGILVCSPTGSTAYNKSLGGAILDPKMKGLELTEIASINSRYYHTLGSPIVFDMSRTIKIMPKKKIGALFTHDTENELIEEFIDCEIKISNDTVKYITKETNDFFKRVQKSFSL